LTKKQCGHRPIGIVPVYFLALADDVETGADSVRPKDHVLKTMLLMFRKALHLAQKPCRLVVTEKEVAVRHSFAPPTEAGPQRLQSRSRIKSIFTICERKILKQAIE